LLTEYWGTDAHEVLTASGGKEALEVFSRENYDLVITDRAMSELCGDEMAAKIKAQAPGQPIIMITGFGDMMEAACQKPDTVDLVLSKPVGLHDLREAIRKLRGPGVWVESLVRRPQQRGLRTTEGLQGTGGIR